MIMDIYSDLFLASISLLGFIAVFLIFRYQVIDRYVDDRKKIIFNILSKRKRFNSSVAINIYNMWKDDFDYYTYFKKFNNKAIDNFVKYIFIERKRRKFIVYIGFVNIILWGILSFYFLSEHIKYNLNISTVDFSFLIFLFVGVLTFTLIYFFYSLIILGKINFKYLED